MPLVVRLPPAFLIRPRYARPPFRLRCPIKSSGLRLPRFYRPLHTLRLGFLCHWQRPGSWPPGEGFGAGEGFGWGRVTAHRFCARLSRQRIVPCLLPCCLIPVCCIKQPRTCNHCIPSHCINKAFHSLYTSVSQNKKIFIP